MDLEDEDNPLIDQEMLDEEEMNQGIPSQPVHVSAEELKAATIPFHKEEAKK